MHPPYSNKSFSNILFYLSTQSRFIIIKHLNPYVLKRDVTTHIPSVLIHTSWMTILDLALRQIS